MGETTQPRWARSWTPWGIGKTEVRIVLAAAMVVSAAAGLWFSRDTTFSIDEFRIFLGSSHISLHELLEPFNGHLILVTRAAYAAMLNLFGAGYFPFRLLAIATLLLTAWLFFLFAERRVGSLVALAPTLVLLFYGSDTYHVIVGNGFTVLLAVAAGVGALLALEREDLAGDIGACLLLTLAVASYSVALPFVAGAAVLVLIGADRWRRSWVFLIPGLLYVIWFAWARNQPGGSSGRTQAHNLLLAPDWAFNSLATVASALLGLHWNVAGFGTGSLLKLDTSWGPALAFAAIAALAWRLWRGPIPRWLWALLAIPATLWVLGAAAALPPTYIPQKPEYIFPATIAVLLVAVEAVRGARWGRRAMILLFAVAAVGVITNVALLREGSARLRVTAAQTRADLATVELAGGHVGLPKAPSSAMAFLIAVPGARPRYEQAVDRFGSPAFSVPELRAQPEPIRERADAALANNLGLRLKPVSGPVKDCRRLTGGPGDGVTFALPTGGAILETHVAPAPVELRRFGSAFTVDAGTLKPGEPMALSTPGDTAPDRWYAMTTAAGITACSL